MDSKVERIVPASVLRIGQSQGKPGERQQQRPFLLEDAPQDPPQPEEPSADGEGRTVSGPDDEEAGARLDLTA